MITPLHYAVSGKNILQNEKVIKLLMSYGARVDLKTQEGEDALSMFKHNDIANHAYDKEASTLDKQTAAAINFILESPQSETWNLSHKPIAEKALHEIDVVALRLALNYDEYKAAALLKSKEVSDSDFEAWAEMNEYSDKIDIIKSYHHEEF
jgi:hypothetical protein